VTELKQSHISEGNLSRVIKDWVLVFLTLAFIALYGFALLGKLRPLADASIITRLEPIIFVMIGYHFGRLPSQQNEETLKKEIERQTQRADAAQHAKETALQSREALDEKVKNARTALAGDAAAVSKVPAGFEASLKDRGSVTAAFNILNS
jgi:hypothetical protein